MTTKKTPKARIRQNRWDNWYGYLGTRRVEAFGNDAQFTAEQHAQRWLADPEAQARNLQTATPVAAPTFDVEVTGLGESVVRILPLTEEARVWIAWNVESAPWQWLGPALCVEHRLVAPLLGGMDRAGLRLTMEQ